MRREDWEYHGGVIRLREGVCGDETTADGSDGSDATAEEEQTAERGQSMSRAGVREER
jgi:hypothetical protein